MVGRFLDWLERHEIRLLVPILLAVVLVAVPTLYTVFPEWATGQPFHNRAAVLVCWLVIAGVGITLTTASDSRLQWMIRGEAEQLARAERRTAITDQFRSILVPGVAGIPAQYGFTAYAPTPDNRYLIPIFPPALDFSDTAIFPVGAGATGKAWESPDRAFVVVGEAVSTAEHRLTKVQSQRYAAYRAVAATVITDLEDRPIGVLTTIGREDDGFFTDEAGVGVDALRQVAGAISWLLPEAVRWMMPTREAASGSRSSHN